MGAVFILLIAILGAGLGAFSGGEEVTVTTELEGGDATSTDTTPDRSRETATPTGGSPEATPSDPAEEMPEETTDEQTSTEPFETSDTDSDTDSDNTDNRPANVIVSKNTMYGSVNNVMPGDSGNVTLNVTNNGTANGMFRVTTRDVVDFENGLTAPERDVDGTAGEKQGELSSALLVRWSINRSGTRVNLTDDISNRDDNYVRIKRLDERGNRILQGETIPEDESATALFEWKVSVDVGDEIQSDSIEFNVGFSLVAS